MAKKFFLIIFLFAIAGFFFVKSDFFARTFSNENEVLPQPIEEIKKEIKSPPPLRAVEESPEAFLTVRGTIDETNLQRKTNGLPALATNEKLAAVADRKVKDMFTQQYFAHESPTGVDSGGLAEAVGYAYIVIGENLALGNYENDTALVQAWMNSPGHRANILNTKYTEIGVAIGGGTFEGKRTLLAVQEFGFPESACPQIDKELKANIDTKRSYLEDINTQLTAKKQELEALQPKRGSEYSEKVSSYNALIEQYNELVAEIKVLITKYNAQVEAFNACRSE